MPRKKYPYPDGERPIAQPITSTVIMSYTPPVNAVYFLEYPSGTVKIGYTCNLKKRLYAHRTLTSDWWLLGFGICTDPRQAEKLIHQHFEAKRQRGELFLLSDKDKLPITCGMTEPELYAAIGIRALSATLEPLLAQLTQE